jgi:hypothetical protein
VLGHCAPIAVVMASSDVSPSFICPSGYTLSGRWKTGPGTTNGNVEAKDAQGFLVDAGWAYLCSALPNEVYVYAKGSDCGQSVSQCPDKVRGSFHVGVGCDGQSSGVGGNNVPIDAGWMGLCVVGSADVYLDVSSDCGGQTSTCQNTSDRGRWHTNPANCTGGVTGESDKKQTIKTGWMVLCEATDSYPPSDPSTLAGKGLFGYQGWFAAQGDGAGVGWKHWAPAKPNAQNLDFDLWPDLSEYTPSELFATDLNMPGGGKAKLFSSAHPTTVDRHFRWMAETGIDGVFLQRFLSDIKGPAMFAFRNTVTENVRMAADNHGRVFSLMYDISGGNEATFVQDVKDDWKFLVDTLKITESPSYLHHNGKPVMAIWGLGFKDRPGTAAQAKELIDYFQKDAPPKYRVTLMGGVPYGWRTGTGSTKPGFGDVFTKFDIISPWSVGRFGSTAGFDNLFNSTVKPDKSKTDSLGVGYAPVAWPGFSWANLKEDVSKFNQIPRNGGTFFWHQFAKLKSINPLFLYVAMYDEVDESTAMFKAASKASDLPADGLFLYLNVDGDSLPTDWYLRLGGAAAKAMSGQFVPGTNLPFSP